MHRTSRLGKPMMDGYIRVSRVAGRAGDSFISPDVQREQIAAWAKLRGVTIAAWHEDLDQSGGSIDRPAFRAALERVDRGETGGLVVAKIDRFARSLSGALEAIHRLEASGAEFVSVADGIDPSTPAGKMLHRLLLVLAEFELDRVRENWRVARERAVARGVHIASRVPTGYVRGASRRLEPHPQFRTVITEVFRRRAGGASWHELCGYLNDSGVIGPWGENRWLPETVQQLIQNRVYLGEARSGDFVNRSAHEPLIDRLTWEASQRAPRRQPPRGDPALLAGLVRCAGCRYLLRPTSMKERSGKRRRMYRCFGRSSAGPCNAMAYISASLIEAHIEQVFFEHAGSLVARGAVDTSSDVADLERRAEEAEAELSAYRDNERIVGALGPERFVEGLHARSRTLDDLHAKLATERDRLGIVGAESHVPLRELWPTLAVVERQRLLRAAFDAVFVRRGRGPVEGRLVVFPRGAGPRDLPSHQNRGAPIRPLN